MVRRFHNSLEQSADRRLRLRRGLAFKFFLLALMFTILMWGLNLLLGQTTLTALGKLASWTVPMLLSIGGYGVAIILGESEAPLWIERTWLAILSTIHSISGMFLIFFGVVFLLSSLNAIVG